MSAIRVGRRCEPCRQRKKKCDQAQPRCSRCTRLGIQCVGSGEQRLKFVDVNTVLSKRSGPLSNGHSSSFFNLGAITPSPSNELTLLRGSFTSIVQCDTPQYGFGLIATFLGNMPVRLGSNKALDLFANTIVLAHAAYVAGSPSMDTAQCFTKALGALRISLGNPVTATSLETLSAIYLMLVAQSMMGTCFNAANGEGLAYLVNALADRTSEGDSFANDLITTLSSQLIFESIVNPNIRISLRVLHILERREKSIPFHCLRVMQCARLRDFIKDPMTHNLEIRSSYQLTGLEVQRFQHIRLTILPNMQPRDRATFCVGYSVMLSYAILLNTIMLRSIEPFSIYIAQDSKELLDEVLSLIEAAKEFRPAIIGAVGSMVFCAWPNDSSRKHEIEQRLSDFLGNFSLVRFKESALWLDRLLGPTNQLLLESIVTVEEPDNRSEACCVM